MKNNAAGYQDNDLNLPSRSWGIFLISILGLFLETLLIRWVGTEIRIFAYLQNTILVTCFLGLGIGMFTASKRIDIRDSLLPLAIFMLLMAIPSTRVALGSISELLSTLGDLIIWGSGQEINIGTPILSLVAGLSLTFGVLILIVDIFVPVGRILGRLLNIYANPIIAYSINVFGSILGTWLFVLLSFFYQPPFVWFIVTACLWAVLILWSNANKRMNFVLLGLTLLLSWFSSQVPRALEVVWSPYQKLAVYKNTLEMTGDYRIVVNNIGYQAIIDLSDAHVSADPARFSPELKGLSQYDLPLLFHPDPKSVLLVGAGSGNDAAGALRNRVQSITAVDIDPAIIGIGAEFHPEGPYSSPNVKVVNDDARSFFATTDQTYDVIAFGLLDSHTTTSLTNARLDHYVYTRESLKQAKSRLADGGVMVLTFEAQKPFIADRMASELEEVFGYPPIVFRIPATSYGWGGVMFVTGDRAVVQNQLQRNALLANHVQRLQEINPIQLPHTTKMTTDDWPYIYLEAPRIPVLYYLLMGLMILVFIRSYKKWEASKTILFADRSFWHFFFLGAAFLLLEVQNISKASVVLGNTWQVNAVIISAVLTMALVANWIAYRFPKISLPWVYLLLISTCLALYFIDLARFGFLPYPLKAAIVGALTSLPMLFSGIVFVRSFASAADKSNALGANLIGALVGALLQSITFITGIKALLLFVAVFYLLSSFTVPSRVKSSESTAPEFAQ